MSNSKPNYDHGIDALKGLAILLVVLIHVVAIEFSFIIPKSNDWNIAIFIDQFSRLSVPLFIAISGYSLALSFSEKSNLLDFFKRRVLKLLPVYLIWSLVTYFLIIKFGSWPNYQIDVPLLPALIFGQVDYHLYFVPMIFQLYLLFPILYYLVKRGGSKTLLVAFIWQLGFYLYVREHVEISNQNLAISDQTQYLFFGTWIFYFVLGIYLRIKGLTLKLNFKQTTLLAVGILATFYWVMFSANGLFENFNNVLLATRFTKISILLYSTLVILFTVNLRNFLTKISFGTLAIIGKYSFSIYLFHVMVLRVINIYILPKDTFSTIQVFLATSVFSFLLALIVNYLSRMSVALLSRGSRS